MTIRLKYKLYIFAFLATILFIQNGYSQDTIKWKSNIKLSFIDFKAQPPKQSNFDAISNLGLNAFTNVEKRNIYVISYFRSKLSWMKNKDSLLLKHEQNHFDLEEIYARKLRSKYASTLFTYENFGSKFDSLYNVIIKDLNYIDSIYDAETDLSKNKQCQEEWNMYIIQMLKELETFSNPIISLRFKEDDDEKQ